jgi:hypothetical protein
MAIDEARRLEVAVARNLQHEHTRRMAPEDTRCYDSFIDGFAHVMQSQRGLSDVYLIFEKSIPALLDSWEKGRRETTA